MITMSKPEKLFVSSINSKRFDGPPELRKMNLDVFGLI